eukprot:RCo004146
MPTIWRSPRQLVSSDVCVCVVGRDGATLVPGVMLRTRVSLPDVLPPSFFSLSLFSACSLYSFYPLLYLACSALLLSVFSSFWMLLWSCASIFLWSAELAAAWL